MPPKFAMAKAKAKAAAKAAGKAKAKAVAKAAAAAPMAAGGAAAPVPRITLITGVSTPDGRMGTQMHDTVGSTEVMVHANALALAFNVTTATCVRPTMELELAVPAPKGIGKGTGPWAPARGWQVTADATVETTGAAGFGMSVTEYNYWVTQDALQYRLT